jgi:LacI family transcriptional regulator
VATIYDVAKAAGVSTKTVSRVLNSDAPVNHATREAVLAAMARLSYVPSNAARSMRSNRSGLIGLITGAISASPRDPQPAGLPDIFIVQGIQSALADSDITLLISDTGGNAERVPHLFRTLLEHRVEGLIYVAAYHQKVSLPRHAGGRPVVLVNCFDDDATPAVVPDDAACQQALVEALIAHGHRRIGFLTLPEELVARGLRLKGHRRALIAAGIDYDPALVITGDHHGGPGEAELLREAIEQLLSLADPPTVLCCGNDRLAMGVYGILRSRGLAVPGEISVAGFDDYRTISETLFPPLTTVELPYAAMGARAARTLLDLIRGEPREAGRSKELVRGPVRWRQSVTVRGPDVARIKSNRRRISP